MKTEKNEPIPRTLYALEQHFTRAANELWGATICLHNMGKANKVHETREQVIRRVEKLMRMANDWITDSEQDGRFPPPDKTGDDDE